MSFDPFNPFEWVTVDGEPMSDRFVAVSSSGTSPRFVCPLCEVVQYQGSWTHEGDLTTRWCVECGIAVVESDETPADLLRAVFRDAE